MSDEPLIIKYKIVGKNLYHSPVPARATDGSACFDLCAWIKEPWWIKTYKDYRENPPHIASIPTGLKLEIPDGYHGEILSRSGLASEGIIVANAPGIIDSDYRGEVMVILINLSNSEFRVDPGTRIAQLIIKKNLEYSFVETNRLSATKRGKKGLGSTGR